MRKMFFFQPQQLAQLIKLVTQQLAQLIKLVTQQLAQLIKLAQLIQLVMATMAPEHSTLPFWDLLLLPLLSVFNL